MAVISRTPPIAASAQYQLNRALTSPDWDDEAEEEDAAVVVLALLRPIGFRYSPACLLGTALFMTVGVKPPPEGVLSIEFGCRKGDSSELYGVKMGVPPCGSGVGTRTGVGDGDATAPAPI